MPKVVGSEAADMKMLRVYTLAEIETFPKVTDIHSVSDVDAVRAIVKESAWTAPSIMLCNYRLVGNNNKA